MFLKNKLKHQTGSSVQILKPVRGFSLFSSLNLVTRLTAGDLGKGQLTGSICKPFGLLKLIKAANVTEVCPLKWLVPGQHLHSAPRGTRSKPFTVPRSGNTNTTSSFLPTLERRLTPRHLIYMKYNSCFSLEQAVWRQTRLSFKDWFMFTSKHRSRETTTTFTKLSDK